MLKLKNITKTYRSKSGGNCTAVKNISLTFNESGLVFICGKSGSGKSTLLNIASGMDSADSGEIIIDGKSTKSFKQSDFDSYRNTYVGYVFQDFNIIDDLNVKENLALSLELQNAVATEDMINSALEMVGLKGYGRRKSFELSGGQRQRVSIARALIKNPKIVFADEPTGSLDSDTGKQIFELLKELSKSRLVIIISHDASAAAYYGDRVITLSDGTIALDQTKVSEFDVEAAKREYQERINSAFVLTSESEKEPIEKFIKTDTKLPFRRAAKIGLSSLLQKKFRFIFVVSLSIIALTVFCLADIMRNYDYYTASLNTFKKLDINTLMLINNKTINNEKMQIEFADSDLDKISEHYGHLPYKAYRYQILFEKFSDAGAAQDETAGINTVVEMGDDINKNTLKGYYNAELIAGDFPNQSDDAIEILISDYLADQLMFYGCVFSNKIVYPNTGHEKLTEAFFEYGGLTFKIAGVYKTDYKDINTYEQKTQFDFNQKNIYSAVLTTKNAVYNFASKNTVVSVNANFELSEDDVLNKRLNILKAENTQSLAGVLGTPIPVIFKNGYSELSTLKADEAVISKSLLDDLLYAYQLDEHGESIYAFEDVTAADFENLQLNLTVSASGKESNVPALKVAGVFDDSLHFSLGDIVLMAEETANLLLRQSQIISHAFLSLEGNWKQNRSLLNGLDNSNIQYLTYASSELEVFDMLFSLLGQILIGASLVLFFFVMMLMFNFISASITSKKKEIGILRTLGARGRDVSKTSCGYI